MTGRTYAMQPAGIARGRNTNATDDHLHTNASTTDGRPNTSSRSERPRNHAQGRHHARPTATRQSCTRARGAPPTSAHGERHPGQKGCVQHALLTPRHHCLRRTWSTKRKHLKRKHLVQSAGQLSDVESAALNASTRRNFMGFVCCFARFERDAVLFFLLLGCFHHHPRSAE